MVDLDEMGAASKRRRSDAFLLVLSGSVWYLLWTQIGWMSWFLPAILASIEAVRLVSLLMVRWAYSEDLKLLRNFPVTQQGGGLQSVVCPHCHGIRAYNGLVRDTENDLDSCICRDTD